MTKTIENLLRNSRLPGPRGNLELLYFFSNSATPEEVTECFSYYKDDLSNSPEEFVVMCAIVGFCILNKQNLCDVFGKIRNYTSHKSWRIREAVAIGIQEIAVSRMDEILDNLNVWIKGNELEQRTVVAAVCEPKLLKVEADVLRVYEMLASMTSQFENINSKLSDNQIVLRKALGYGWSVAIVALPESGKKYFEKLVNSKNRHIRWIVAENLKKKRLAVMDEVWLNKMLNLINQ